LILAKTRVLPPFGRVYDPARELTTEREEEKR
jgi:hypothetical protein